jgi:hypothetical protein
MNKADTLEKLIIDTIKGINSFGLIANNDFSSVVKSSGEVKYLLDRDRSEFHNYLVASKLIVKKLIELHLEITIASPKVYIYRSSRAKTETMYFNAKAHWLNSEGVKKEVTVYVGKADDFSNQIDNPLALKIATEKLRKLLLEKKRKNKAS